MTCSLVRFVFQLEEVRSIPASSEKAISEATARKEDLEEQKAKEEDKLKEVMESLKEETSGLQQDKEVYKRYNFRFQEVKLQFSNVLSLLALVRKRSRSSWNSAKL